MNQQEEYEAFLLWKSQNKPQGNRAEAIRKQPNPLFRDPSSYSEAEKNYADEAAKGAAAKVLRDIKALSPNDSFLQAVANEIAKALPQPQYQMSGDDLFSNDQGSWNSPVVTRTY